MGVGVPAEFIFSGTTLIMTRGGAGGQALGYGGQGSGLEEVGSVTQRYNVKEKHAGHNLR
jgi:hypothetical protein